MKMDYLQLRANGKPRASTCSSKIAAMDYELNIQAMLSTFITVKEVLRRCHKPGSSVSQVKGSRGRPTVILIYFIERC